MDGQTSLSHSSLSPAARVLGYAGLLPQIICLAMILTRHEWRYAALEVGFAYPAAIFSFLGGVWWGQTVAAAKEGRPATTGAYILAVLPSLLTILLWLPRSLGWDWPAPALLYLGALILASPLVDRALGHAAPDFLRLRWHLSIGLGTLTIALGLIAPGAL